MQITESPECESDAFIITEVQLILAEKRTSMAAMRTGIAVFALPLSVLSVLIATSQYYDAARVLQWIIPLVAICVALVVLGSYLIIRSIIRLHRHDYLISKLKQKHSRIADFVD